MRTIGALVVVATLACTANVQDLGAPEPPPLPTRAAPGACPPFGAQGLHGLPCTDDDPLVCRPYESLDLRCVCGVDHRWVCLDGTLGLLSEHAITPDLLCGDDVVLRSSTLTCTCASGSGLECETHESFGAGNGVP